MGGATLEMPAPGTSGLSLVVNSDDLGLDTIINPGFDVLLSGVGTRGTGGAPDMVAWTVGLNPANPPGKVSVDSILSVTIKSVTGSILTNVLPIAAPFVAASFKSGQFRLFDTSLNAVGNSNQIQITTDSLGASIAITSLEFSCGHAGTAYMLPVFDFVFGPYKADRCGHWCTPDAIAKFTTTLLNMPPNGAATYQWEIVPAGAAQIIGPTPNSAASTTNPVCYVQMPDDVADFTVRLTVTFYTKAGNNPAATVTKDYSVQMVLPAAANLCTFLGNLRFVPQPMIIGDPAIVGLGNVAIQLPADELIGLQSVGQYYATKGAALAAAAEESLKALREWERRKHRPRGSRRSASSSIKPRK